MIGIRKKAKKKKKFKLQKNTDPFRNEIESANQLKLIDKVDIAFENRKKERKINKNQNFKHVTEQKNIVKKRI